MEQPQLDKIKRSLERYNRPIYETIIDTLQKMIMSEELAPGTKFPPDKKLAIELGIGQGVERNAEKKSFGKAARYWNFRTGTETGGFRNSTPQKNRSRF